MADLPPSYEHATGNSNPNPSTRPQVASSASSNYLDVPRNGIPRLHRRSMEDEGRPLPTGWVRQFDAKEAHQFFVDTRADPPRSIWCHPHDDETYLASLTAEQREVLQDAEAHPSHSSQHPGLQGRRVSKADLAAESSAEDSDHEHGSSANQAGKTQQPHTSPPSSQIPASLPPRPSTSTSTGPPKGVHKLGRSLKDSLLGSTHAEREVQRTRRAEEERQAYAQYMHLRDAMVRAQQSGEPQLLGKDRDGKDVYMQPPMNGGGYGFGGGYGHGYGPGYAGGGYGFNPYQQQGYHEDRNRRYVQYPRPGGAYGRPGGTGYGGGMGLPLVGGLMGGALLGGLLF